MRTSFWFLYYLITLSTAVSFSLIQAQLRQAINNISNTGVQLLMGPAKIQPSASYSSQHNANLALSDILPITRSVNIFASLTRESQSVSERLSSNAINTTLLAPLNSAMQALPRKPWQDQPQDNTGISAEHDRDKAKRNLEKFVEAHIVPVHPWMSGEDNKVKSLGGVWLWWEERNGERILLPDELVVEEVAGKVKNGEIWTIKGVVGLK